MKHRSPLARILLALAAALAFDACDADPAFDSTPVAGDATDWGVQGEPVRGGGLRLTYVGARKLADQVGLQVDDVLEEVNGLRIRTRADVDAARYRDFAALSVYSCRAGALRYSSGKVLAPSRAALLPVYLATTGATPARQRCL